MGIVRFENNCLAQLNGDPHGQLTPLWLAVALGVAMLKEPLTLAKALSATAIVIGVVLVKAGLSTRAAR
jgi:drug/metabolite transporter (DMT)-like permease